MTDQLFTLLCEFDGGTYISQVRANDTRQALVAWSKVLRCERPMGDAADLIANEALDEVHELSAIRPLSGVWCWSAMVNDQLVLTNIVCSVNSYNCPKVVRHVES